MQNSECRIKGLRRDYNKSNMVMHVGVAAHSDPLLFKRTLWDGTMKASSPTFVIYISNQKPPTNYNSQSKLHCCDGGFVNISH